MYPSWQQMGASVPGQPMQYYGTPNTYQQQMYQWYYQQNPLLQPAGVIQPPVPTSMPPLPEAAPPPPSEEKPPLPPEPPPAPPAEEEKQELKPVTSEEQKKLTDLQQQAAHWQQTQQWPAQPQQQWPQQQQQWTGADYQQYQLPPPSAPGGELKIQFDAVQKEETEFNQQYTQWKQQYDDWKKQNQNHPNKEQFKQYEAQWQQYEQQMEDKKKDIQQRKLTIQNQMAMTSPPMLNIPGMPPHQVTSMPPNQITGMPPNQVHGMPPGQVTGMPTNQVQGIPSNQVTGMPPNQQGMPPNQLGIAPNQQNMPPQHQGMPSNSQGIAPHNQGMPPNQAMMQQNPNQIRMGTPLGVQQNNQGMRMGGPMGMRQNNPQNLGGPGGVQNQNQRMRFPQNQQQMRMGAPGQVNQGSVGIQDEQDAGMENSQSGLGGPRPRFQGGRFTQQQNQMNRMPGPRGPILRGQRPLLSQDNRFRGPGMFEDNKGHGDLFEGEGGEEDMCLDDESENLDTSNQFENPFRRPDIQQMMNDENFEENEEFPENSMQIGGNNQFRGMQMKGNQMRGGAQNMQMRGGTQNMQMRGRGQNMHMRGNFQNMGNPRGMGGVRGQLPDLPKNQGNNFGNTPQRMPQRGPISLMDIRFDKPPPVIIQKDDPEKVESEQQKEITAETKKEQGSKEQKKEKNQTEVEGPIQKEFALGSSEKTATSGLEERKGGIPGFGDVSDSKKEETDKDQKEEKEKPQSDQKVVGDEKKSDEKSEETQNDTEQSAENNQQTCEGSEPISHGAVEGQQFLQNRGHGPRPFGPRHLAPNRGQGGPRHFVSNQLRGQRPFTPNQVQGQRQIAPNQGQGQRQVVPDQGQGLQQTDQFQEQTQEFGQMGPMQGQGPRQFGPRGFVQRGGGQRGQGPRQFGPRGFGNQGPRGFRQMGPNQGLFQQEQYEEQNLDQSEEQGFDQSNAPLDFKGKVNQNKMEMGKRGRGRGQMRGRGRGRGWQQNQFHEEHQQEQVEVPPDEPVYNEEEGGIHKDKNFLQEKERMKREMEEEGEQWMAAWQEGTQDRFDDRRDPWAGRRTPPLPNEDRFDRLPYDDPYRRDPYYDRIDPYYDRRDPYYPERRPYDYDPYRPLDYWYPDRYEPLPRPPSPRLFIAPEVIDHGHKSAGLADFTQQREPIEYQPPQVIDYGHGKTSEDSSQPPEVSRDINPEYSSDSIPGYGRDAEFSRDNFSQDYSRDSRSSRDYSRDSYSGSRERDRDKDRPSSKTVHEPKVETVNIDDLLLPPGRKHRPPQIVVILRGLPGSGKTYVGKLLKDKEVQNGGGAPRMLCLDDYFMVEVEKTENDPETGKKVKKKVLEYEYEPDMESSYRKNMYKSFKKTIDDGFFPFIIVDAVNDKERHFEEFWSYAKSKGFQVYIAEIQADASTCAKRNTHNRSLKEIEKVEKGWQETPKHYLRLDVRTILQEVSIQEVEMETEDEQPSAPSTEKRKKEESDEEEDAKLGEVKKSKWELETSGTQLDKLDGLIHHNKKIAPVHQSMEDFLQLPDDYDSRPLAPGQKRVRWADIEERKVQSRRRDIGFVVGQTQRDWERITDDSYADRQLNRTKYF